MQLSSGLKQQQELLQSEEATKADHRGCSRSLGLSVGLRPLLCYWLRGATDSW